MDDTFRLSFLILSVILALAALFALASWNSFSILIAAGLAVLAGILIGLFYRRPPRPTAVTVPAP
jgi:hypothetical protein